MIASAQTIKFQVNYLDEAPWQRHVIEPFHERSSFAGLTYGLSPAGYDIRVAEELELGPSDFKLASSVESFHMPIHWLGVVHDKSTWARQGICLQNTVIEPGWRGQSLTLEISNHSPRRVHIKAGSPIAQVVFHILDRPTHQPYNGRYQDAPAGASPAIFTK